MRERDGDGEKGRRWRKGEVDRKKSWRAVAGGV
jgi:hypothetical protein